MKKTLINIIIFLLCQNFESKAASLCIPLTKSQLQHLLESPNKSIVIRKRRLSLINPSYTTYDDLIPLLHSNQTADIIQPVAEDSEDTDTICTYSIGPNDQLHLRVNHI